MHRRLAAVLAADMVGYSRLVAADESGTLSRQKAHRSALIDPKIAQYGGHIVKTTGDGVLVLFPGILDAVQCAVEIQRLMPERESGESEERRILYRIGINLGDIVLDEGDIFGDGVNIAARLEGICEPGGVCISDVVYQNIQGRLGSEFRDGGQPALKNMERKVRVWNWRGPTSHEEQARAPENRLPPPAAKPSIAVLPFANMSGDLEQEYFAEGITEDIITELSRFRSLFVIARNSSFKYKGGGVKVQDVAADLGVQYVVEGSVRKAAGRVRITAQLIEAASGNHLWAERYDRSLEDIFAVQDEVVGSIVAKLELTLNEEATSRAKRASQETITAYDYLLKGRSAWWRGNFSDGFHFVELAVSADSQYAAAHAWLALQYAYQTFSNTIEMKPDELARKSHHHAETALKLDDRDPFVHMAASMAFGFTAGGSKERGWRHIEIAYDLNPHDCDIMYCRAYHLAFLGRHEEALNTLERLQRLNPVSGYMVAECLTDLYFMMGDYRASLRTFDDQGHPPPQVLVVFAACHAQLGEEMQARDCLKEMEKSKPRGFDPLEFARAQIAACAREEDADLWKAAFKRAGLTG
ncbi:adenylate/guanylate cyclase domain-containing protein [Limibacillus halophilus]